MRPANELWQAALGELELQVSRGNFCTWLKGTTGDAIEGSTLVVGVPNAFCQEWLEQRLLPQIRDTVSGLAGQALEVRFSLGTGGHYPPPCPTGLNAAYSFGSFAVGDCNLVAHCAATEVAQRPGQLYNPLVVWGGTGLGKTHLLQATTRRAMEAHIPALYLTAEQYTTQFISALRHQAVDSFRHRFLRLSLLVVDDIQFLTGKGQTQEGFFHTFNELYNTGGQLLVAADRHPKAIEGLHEHLRSRLSGGLVAEVRPPGEAERLAILRAHLGHDTTPPPGVLEVIAKPPVSDVRELLGRLNQVRVLSAVLQRAATVELAQQALDAAPQPEQALPAQLIVDAVLHHFRLPKDAFMARTRQPQLSHARQVAIYLLKEETHLPLSQIGQMVGGLTKSSVIYAYRQAVRSLPQSTHLSQPLAAIRQGLQR